MTATHGPGSENQAVSEAAVEGAKRFLWPFVCAGRSEASDDVQEASETSTDHLWEPLKPSRAQRAFQAVLVVGVVGVLAANVWSLAHPRSVVVGPQSMVLPETVGVDVVGASAVAEDVAWAFMNLDDPEAREARLEMVWAKPESSWDGKGSITVDPAGVYTVKTTVRDAMHVDVLVAVHVSTDTGASWVGVLVPISVASQGAVVAGAPSIVGLPKPGVIEASTLPESDVQLTADTKVGIEAFFKAWAAGDVSALCAPGAVIPAPPAGLGTVMLDSWKAFEGAGATRTGQAHVTWSIGGAQLASTYTLTLTQVSGGDASRWQVSSLTY